MIEHAIILGKGIGKIRLGMTREEIISILGKPQIERIDDREVKYLEKFIFDSVKIELFFPSPKENFASISVWGSQYHIGNKLRIGDTEDTLLNFAEENDWGKSEMYVNDENSYSFRFEKVGLTIVLRDNKIFKIIITGIVKPIDKYSINLN